MDARKRLSDLAEQMEWLLRKGRRRTGREQPRWLQHQQPRRTRHQQQNERDESHGEMEPEVMAAIMHLEEKGLNLDSDPRRLFDCLFPVGPEDHVLPVGSLEPSARKLKDIMIPMLIPTAAMFHPAYEEAAAMAADSCYEAKEDIFSDKCGEEHLQKNLAHMLDKKDGKDADLWGGSSSCTTLSDSEQLLSEVEPPRTANRIQLRGSRPPPWFPGYFMILPGMDQPSVSESPSQVMMSAWKAVHPENFEDNGRIII